MVRFFLAKPISVLITFLAICLLGLYASFLLPISLLPALNIPQIVIEIRQENYSSSDIEQSIVSPLRTKLGQIPGLKNVVSECRDNHAMVKLEFEFGSKMDYAFLEVNDRVDQVMSQMPRDIKRPIITKVNATDLPVFTLNVQQKAIHSDRNSPANRSELSSFVQSVLKPRIEQMKEVALVELSGEERPVISIRPRKQVFAKLNIENAVIKKTLEAHSYQLGGITVRNGQHEYNVTIVNELHSINQLKELTLLVNNRLVKLIDIADITLGVGKADGAYLYNNEPAICLPIVKSPETKIAEMRQSIEQLVKHLEAEYPELRFTISRDQTQLLAFSISNLKQNLVQGCILAIVILFFFIRDVRNPLLIGISLPVALVISLLFFSLFKLSINIVSLSGLILGIGMMIDNSIIVIDNILQHQERGLNRTDSIITGTNEVIGPMISSTLTSCAVFFPLIFLSGISGELFYDQAMAIAIGQGVSLVVSISLIPVLFDIINRKPQTGFEKRLIAKNISVTLENTYERIFTFIRTKQALFWLLTVLLIGSGYYAYFKIEKRQMPSIKEVECMMYIDWGNGVGIAENTVRVQQLLRNNRYIKASNSYIGAQGFLLQRGFDQTPSESEIWLSTASPSDLKRAQIQLAVFMKQAYPQSIFRFSTPQNPFSQVFSSEESYFEIQLANPNASPVVSAEMMALIDEIHQNVNYPVDEPPKHLQYEIRPDIAKSLLLDVDINDVYFELQAAMGSQNLSFLKSSDRFVPVVLETDTISIETLLSRTFVTNAQGAKIPISSLATIKQSYGYRTVYGSKIGSYIPLRINLPDEQVNNVIAKVKELASTHAAIMPSFTGSHFRNKQLIREMLIVLIISIVLLFFILAAQFESLGLPFIVLIEIPIDIAGGLLILYLAGSSLNIMSLIGFVVMGGIIINDSILKIDTIKQLRKSGLPPLEAVLEGGRRRLKPILMTSLTTIIAIIPQVFGSGVGAQLQQPLSFTILGGMSIGTFVSLFMVPLLYLYFAKK